MARPNEWWSRRSAAEQGAIIAGVFALVSAALAAGIGVVAATRSEPGTVHVEVSSAQPTPVNTSPESHVRVDADVFGYQVDFRVQYALPAATRSLSIEVSGLEGYLSGPATIEGDGTEAVQPRVESPDVAVYHLTPSNGSGTVRFSAIRGTTDAGIRIFRVLAADQHLTYPPISTPLYIPQLVPPPLEISYVAARSEVRPGDLLVFTMNVRNSGDHAIHDAFEWNNNPVDLEYVGGTGKYTFRSTGREHDLPTKWYEDGVNFGTLEPGDEVIVRYSARIIGSTAEGTVISAVAGFGTKEANRSVVRSASVRLVRPSYYSLIDVQNDGSGYVVAATFVNDGSANLNDLLVSLGADGQGRFQDAPTIATFVLAPDETKQVTIREDWSKELINLGNLPPGVRIELRFRLDAGHDEVGDRIATIFSGAQELPEWKRSEAFAP